MSDTHRRSPFRRTARAEAAYLQLLCDHARRTRSKHLCPTCGEGDPSGYGCYICRPPDSVMNRIPDWMGEVVWAEACHARQQGLTARHFFNRLTLAARRTLMAELSARVAVRTDSGKPLTSTMQWLRHGLRPGTV